MYKPQYDPVFSFMMLLLRRYRFVEPLCGFRAAQACPPLTGEL